MAAPRQRARTSAGSAGGGPLTAASLKRRLDKLATVHGDEGYSAWVGRPAREWPTGAVLSYLIGVPVPDALAWRVDDIPEFRTETVAAGGASVPFADGCRQNGTTLHRVMAEARKAARERG